MSRHAETTFLNVDLDLKSQFGLSRLLSALGDSVAPVHAEDGFACLELDEQPESPEEAVMRLATLITRLPKDAREEWDRCSERTLDIGIQAGATPHQVRYQLPVAALALAVSINAEVVITVYACPEPAP
ncbi:hypothetical protein HUA78_44810 [Myxococcus sp. CA033]|uniref:hypothetical protein n=1 Tax=Myxococcus sp. CA033 TaxID=2741516 RepID=UPI00157B6F93|nr:hypothetical protein [Myxococcus sp. CA033]NTX41576.1 hypothetical protein [Myxococcus sp. CA033]